MYLCNLCNIHWRIFSEFGVRKTLFTWLLIFGGAALPAAAQTPCSGGTLIFREDFGGNDPSDPEVSSTPVPSMDPRYYQTPCNNSNYCLTGGYYLVAKKGNKNGAQNDSYSQWHIQDDHTYPNDYTRGYLLEIDGDADQTKAFYSTQIDGLCEGARLNFAVYVANVMTWGQCQYFIERGYHYIYARLKLSVINAANGSTLASYNTGDILPDSTITGSGAWRQSSAWNKHNFDFVMPNGTSSVILKITNDGYNAIGNDFAIDDIEIRICTPPVTVAGIDSVCKGKPATLQGTFANDGTFAEPLEYRWLYSKTGDLTTQATWQTVGTNSDKFDIGAMTAGQAGFYRLAVATQGGLDNVNCRAMSDPIQVCMKECTAPCVTLRDTLPTVTVCHGEVYNWGGTLCDTAGYWSDTLKTSAGCDRILTLDLRIRDEIRTDLQATICDGDSIPFDGKYLKQNGTYTCTLKAANGCDSTVTLQLTKLPPATTTLKETVCEGDSTLFGGNYRKQAGIYTDTLTACNGCDSIVRFELTTRSRISFTGDLSVTLCHGDSILFGGVYRKETGVFQHTFQSNSPDGCDSVVNLHLTVRGEMASTIQRTVCHGDSMLFGGIYRNKSGIYADTLTAQSGCDSIARLDLHIRGEIATRTALKICDTDSVLFGGTYRRATGTYVDTLTAQSGCDSIATLDLLVRRCHQVNACADTLNATSCQRSVAVKLSDNDTYTCAAPTFALIDRPTIPGAKAFVRGDSLIYENPLLSEAGSDSLHYSICCGDEFCDTGIVRIFVKSQASVALETMSNTPVCPNDYAMFRAKFHNNGLMAAPYICLWQTSSDGQTWTAFSGWKSFGGTSLSEIYQVADTQNDLFRLIITSRGNESLADCYAVSNTVRLNIASDNDTIKLSGCGSVEYDGNAYTRDTTFFDTAQGTGKCGTLVSITVYHAPRSERSFIFCDTISYNGQVYRADTTIVEHFDTPWQNDTPCDSTVTTHLVRDCAASGTTVANLIVNKYDWIVLCNNRLAATLVPDHKHMRYQWYVNDTRIDGATDDYYTTDSPLNGCFLLRLLIDSDTATHTFVSERLCINGHELAIVPNPVQPSHTAVVDYNFSDAERNGLYVEIYDNVGVRLHHFEPTAYPIVLPTDLPVGIYTVKIVTGTLQVFTIKLIVK